MLKKGKDRFVPRAFSPGKSLHFSLITNNTQCNRKSANWGRDQELLLTWAVCWWQIMKRIKQKYHGLLHKNSKLDKHLKTT